MNIKRLRAVYVCTFLCVLAHAGMANIVTNGGLELLPGDTFRTVSTGTAYAGWNSVGNADVEFDAVYFLPKAEGSGCVDLNGIGFEGAIAQTLKTEPGVLYRVRFAMSGNPGLPGQNKRGDKTMTVSWGVTNTASFGFQHAPADEQTSMRWEYHEMFVPGTGQDELRFTSTTSAYNDAGPVIDDVSVTAVPDPFLFIRVSEVEICWNSDTNFSYQLEYRSSLTTTNSWVPWGPPVAGTGGIMCTNDAVAPTEPRKFYRVVRLP